MSRPYEETCKCGVDNNITEFSIDEGLWCCKTTQVSFSSCQRNLIKTFQIEAVIALITKMILIFS